jgi:16S rRNA (cytidine1402-2'-O)-methyltransferase
MPPGTLYIVATPIGNLGDVTLRALEVLRSADRIAAEDTRHSKKLLAHFDIHKPLLSHHAHNVEPSAAEVIERLRSGENIALVTDAGTPGLSDPGSMIVHRALEAELPVTVVPGPTAVVAALVVSGLPTHPFAFLGFPPAKGSGRNRFFRRYADLPMTRVLFESARRLPRTLNDLQKHWGDRRAAVAREITKRFEEIFRGTLSEARKHFGEGTLGEVTLVVESAPEESAARAGTDQSGGASDWREQLRSLLREDGVSLRDAVDQVSASCGVSRKRVYSEALRITKGNG